MIKKLKLQKSMQCLNIIYEFSVSYYIGKCFFLNLYYTLSTGIVLLSSKCAEFWCTHQHRATKHLLTLIQSSTLFEELSSSEEIWDLL